MSTVTSAALPPTVAALKNYPILWQQVEAGMRNQIERIVERQAHFVPPRHALKMLDDAIASLDGGLISLEGVPGSGVTSLLCHLAATRAYAFWICENDDSQGIAGLCAQLIALHKLSVPLVSPAAASDPRVLEQLLEEAAQRQQGNAPVVLLIDALNDTDQPRDATPMLIPTWLPPHVLLIYGCTPDAHLPCTPVARLMLPSSSDEDDVLHLAVGTACSLALRETLIARSEGNVLYIRLALGLLDINLLTPDTLPLGLDALHAAWWNQLDTKGRRLALLLTVAGEALPDALCAELLSADPHPLFARWHFLLEHKYGDTITRDGARQPGQIREEDDDIPTTAFYHQATRTWIAQHAPDELAHTHAEIVAFARTTIGLDNKAANSPNYSFDPYLLRQCMRHAALSNASIRARVLPDAISRTWVRLQQRRGTSLSAVRDAAWELRTVADDGPLLQLVHSMFVTGSLATLARSLPTDAPAEALLSVLATPERDAVLKSLLNLCDQLPDGRAKAEVLRRLGEVCYPERRMRTTAMRLLSQALDLEAQQPPHSWRDEREQLFVSFARAVISEPTWSDALAISTRISHPERRGMVETEIVRHLLRNQDFDHAEVVAHGITHEGMRTWAQAEVVVARARTGDMGSAEEMLGQLTLETAKAWAYIELACDLARNDERAASAWIDQLPTESQRDRGRSQLAHALAEADKDGDALAMAEQIRDVAIRVTALLDLRLTLDGLVAMLALEMATSAINALEGDDRVPLITALAAAHAALGRRERAVGIAIQLELEEERNRALVRVAIALAGAEEFIQAHEVVALLSDDDDRDWTLAELTGLLARAGRWEEARTAGQQIVDLDQRARTLAELAIQHARGGNPLLARNAAKEIELASERARALTAIVPLLVASGETTYAFADQELFDNPDARSRYQTALVSALATQASDVQSDTSQITALLHARELALTIARPLDRVRALLALAQHGARSHPSFSRSSLGFAIRTSAVGRSEALHCLELAAPLLAQIGGAKLLVDVSATLEEIDGWLQG